MAMNRNNTFTQTRELGPDQRFVYNTPREGQTWGGGIYAAGGGLTQIIPAGYVFSNGQWVSPLVAQANGIAAQKMGYETENARLGSLLTKEYVNNAQTRNQLFSDTSAQLRNLLNNPSSITEDPGYKFQFDQGMEALNRTAAAKGMLGSGNRLMDLVKYGQGMASSAYNNRLNTLSNLSSSSWLQDPNAGRNHFNVNPQGGVTLSGSY